jgi:DNA-directed RNA polymerase subunit RPC12/RpoP
VWLAVNTSKLRIEYQCPQCGAPAELSETDRLFDCAFCRVKSYLLASGYFRYLLPHKATADQTLIYFPYWRFRGMLFAYGPQGVSHRFVDASHQAVARDDFPISVGLRSQALKLRFVSPDTPGHFIHPQVDRAAATEQLAGRFTQEFPTPILQQAHVGETLSMIYAPFYIGDGLVDAVLDRPTGHRPEAADLTEKLPGGAPDWRIRFLATLCPACGWDLQGERDAHVLACRNCQSLWRPGRRRFERVGFARVESRSPEAVYLPFWRIQAEVGGLALESYADLVRAANLPRSVQPGWETRPFRFWAPAFKVRPGVLLRLARALTLAEPFAAKRQTLPAQGMQTVNLPVTEALDIIKINLAGFLRPASRVPELLPALTIRPRKYLLVYLPFEARPHDLVNDDLAIAVNRSHLRLAANL